MRRATRSLIHRSLTCGRPCSDRAGEMDAKTIIIIVLALVGGLALLVCAGVALLLVLPAVQQARTAARGSQSRNNLKQIALALHNYNDAFRVFPPGGVYAEDGTPYQSWQAMTLPYFEQAALYESIDFHRPWTDPVNAPAFATEVPEFLNPNEPVRGGATGGAPSHYAGNSHVLFENSSTRIRDVTDGTSNTLLAGEVAAGYRAWGDPQNVRDPGNGILSDGSSFGSPGNPAVCTFILMDGSARAISSSIDPDVLKALATPDGGEQLPSDF